MKHILVDGDLLVYRSCSTAKPTNFEEHCDYFASILDFVLWEIEPFPSQGNHTIYLSGPNNFRKRLYPDYKANRKGPKPPYFQEVFDWVVEEYNAEVCDGYEADDGISMAAHQRGFKNVVIASSDKDFRQLPTDIYSTYTWKRETITKSQATRNFWTQVLTGDSVDNIKGAKGIGPAKAAKLLVGCKRAGDYEKVVRKVFLDIDPVNGEADYTKTYNCVKLLRNLKEIPEHV